MPYISIVEVGTMNNTFIDKKCRHEFYQKPEEVVLSILAKGIPANNVSVDFGEQIVRHRSAVCCLMSLFVFLLGFTIVENLGFGLNESKFYLLCAAECYN